VTARRKERGKMPSSSCSSEMPRERGGRKIPIAASRRRDFGELQLGRREKDSTSLAWTGGKEKKRERTFHAHSIVLGGGSRRGKKGRRGGNSPSAPFYGGKGGVETWFGGGWGGGVVCSCLCQVEKERKGWREKDCPLLLCGNRLSKGKPLAVLVAKKRQCRVAHSPCEGGKKKERKKGELDRSDTAAYSREGEKKWGKCIPLT